MNPLDALIKHVNDALCERHRARCAGGLHSRHPSWVGLSLSEVERQAILATLQFCAGDKLEAARVLGIGKTTLYRKVREYGLARESEVIEMGAEHEHARAVA